jgi:hypothetical protein
MSPRTLDLSKATGSSGLDVLAAAAATVEEPVTRTRYGRVSKPPVKYEPVEKVEDDYATDDYDSDESEIASNFEDDDDEEEDDEDDADDDGNLDGFVVADKSESSESDSEDDGQPAIPIKKRTPVKKRPVAAPRKR